MTQADGSERQPDSEPSPLTIELRGVTKVYGRQSVLTDASMSIARGSSSW